MNGYWHAAVCLDGYSCLYWQKQQFVLTDTAVCVDRYSCLYWQKQRFVLTDTAVCIDGYSSLCWRIRQFVLTDTAVCIDGYSCLCWQIQQFVLTDTAVCADRYSSRMSLAAVWCQRSPDDQKCDDVSEVNCWCDCVCVCVCVCARAVNCWFRRSDTQSKIMEALEVMSRLFAQLEWTRDNKRRLRNWIHVCWLWRECLRYTGCSASSCRRK
jgi:uncharacterized protein (DUF779 family)